MMTHRRSRTGRPSAAIAVCSLSVLLLTLGEPLRAAVVLDADFDHGSLDEANSVATETLITLAGRDNYNPGQWKWLYFSASGVADLQPQFRIGDNFAGGGSNLVGHKTVYSYDRENWLFFDNNVRQSSLDRFSFFNNQPFAEDTVYIAYGLPYPNLRAANYVRAASGSPWASPTPSANQNLSVGQSPGGVDDLGRNISNRDIYGFKITDSSSTARKAKVALLSGVHANETLGNYTLEGLLDFLLGDSLQAGLLRKQAEFYVYPMVNPDGRHAGYNRSTVQNLGLDPNRYWLAPNYGGLDDIEVVGEALIADTGGEVDYLIDFHSDTSGKNGHYGYVLPEYQSDPLWQNLRQLEPAVRTENALLIDDTAAKFGRDVLGAGFSITFETQFLADENVDRFLNLGRNWGLALFNALSAPADLNLDGVLDAEDWRVFLANSETDLSRLSPAESYLRGDLDGDGQNSISDFGVFKAAYERAHGGGSFAAMLATVPEPGGAAVAAVAGPWLMLAARGRRLTTHNSLGGLG